MYNPRHFAAPELPLAMQVMAEHPLALLVGPDAEGQGFGTHVPLSAFDDGAGGFYLEGHMARANPHWGWLSAQQTLMVAFSGPGAYVSPRHYDSVSNVPTWNYMAVHAWGEISLITEPDEKDQLLKRLIARQEPAYDAQWRSLPPDYQQKMLNAIVGFRIRVTRWECKLKLSQNRATAERQRIHAALAEGTGAEQQLARWMAQLGLA